MTSYRTYCINEDGHFSTILESSFSDDAAAIADAEARLEGHYAMDVFCDGRRVGRVESATALLAAQKQSA